MDTQTLVNFALLVLLFVLFGGVFAATEIALVSLRESQFNRVEQHGARAVRGSPRSRVTPTGSSPPCRSASRSPGSSPRRTAVRPSPPTWRRTWSKLGLGEDAAETVALVVLTLFIAYLSLVLGELVPKRLALQKRRAVVAGRRRRCSTASRR